MAASNQASKGTVIVDELTTQFGVVTADGIHEFADEELARAHAAALGADARLLVRMATPWRKA